MLTKLKGLIAAVVAFGKKNPAVVSWAVSMVITLAAHYGLHVTPTELAGLLAVLLTVTHGMFHVAIRKAP